MPNTTLFIRDGHSGLETKVGHQGHGLQRTLVISLLKLLEEVQRGDEGGGAGRPIMLLVEEPELYMHPPMERRMRDVLVSLAGSENMQVTCCTHSPVFLDIAERYKSIVQLRWDDHNVVANQVTEELFVGPESKADKDRLAAVSRFNPGVNELFFSPEVVLLEEFSAVAAFTRAAELSGVFDRHPMKRHDVALIDCGGKGNIPAFQAVLNKFGVAYRVVHDKDQSNPQAAKLNDRIHGFLDDSGIAVSHAVGPEDLESCIGYEAPGKSKPLVAVSTLESQWSAKQRFGNDFQEALNYVYFGSTVEP